MNTKERNEQLDYLFDLAADDFGNISKSKFNAIINLVFKEEDNSDLLPLPSKYEPAQKFVIVPDHETIDVEVDVYQCGHPTEMTGWFQDVMVVDTKNAELAKRLKYYQSWNSITGRWNTLSVHPSSVPGVSTYSIPAAFHGFDYYGARRLCTTGDYHRNYTKSNFQL